MQRMELEKSFSSGVLSAEKVAGIRNAVERFGFCVTTGLSLSKENFLNLSYAFGEVIPPGRGCDLVTVINTTDEVGEKVVPLHNDKSYWRVPPRLLVLFVSDAAGMVEGAMILADLRSSFAALSPSDQNALRNTNAVLSSPRNRDAARISAPVVNDFNGELAFFRFRADLIESDATAFSKLYTAASSRSFPVALDPGNLLVLDNWLVAHGRSDTKFSQGGRRLAYRSLIV